AAEHPASQRCADRLAVRAVPAARSAHSSVSRPRKRRVCRSRQPTAAPTHQPENRCQTSHAVRMSSGGVLILVVVCPGGGLVVEAAGLEAAMQDADQPVAELTQGGVMAGTAGAELVVVDPGAG